MEDDRKTNRSCAGQTFGGVGTNGRGPGTRLSMNFDRKVVASTAATRSHHPLPTGHGHDYSPSIGEGGDPSTVVGCLKKKRKKK